MSLNQTGIEWCRNPDGTKGFSWNPITGCLNCTPEGLCKGGLFPCWAYKTANGRLKKLYLANKNIAVPDNVNVEFMRGHGGELVPYNDPFYPRFWEDRLESIKRPLAPSAWAGNAPYTRHPEFEPVNRHAKKKARGIFVCDMSDLFGIGIPEEWTNRVLEAIRINGVDRFYLLTKQPQNLIKFSPFPDNCWVGASWVGDDKAIPLKYMQGIEAKVKFISFEPLLQFPGWWNSQNLYEAFIKAGIKWVIIGAQTKPTVYPKIEWVQEIVQACHKAGISVFLKDKLKPILPGEEPFYSYYTPIQDGVAFGKYRQEMPK